MPDARRMAWIKLQLANLSAGDILLQAQTIAAELAAGSRLKLYLQARVPARPDATPDANRLCHGRAIG